MADINVEGVYRVRSKGRTYYYAWKGKGAPRLYSSPGSPEFIQELADAIKEHRIGDKSKIAGLCSQWRATDSFTKPPSEGGLSPSTLANWRPWLDKIEGHFGPLSIAQFDRPIMRVHIRKWRDQFKDTPRAADMGKQVLSGLLSYAVSEGLLSSNLCFGIPNLYSSNRADRIWRPEDLAKLESTASAEITLAAKLAALTGLRQGDLLRLAWSHIGPLAIELRTGKSGGKRLALVPLYDELKALLDAAPKRATTVLTNSEGLPWKSGFGSSWNKAIKEAGLQNADLHFHDLRGTAATRMYVGGLTIREIAEAMAWSENQVERLVNIYVKRDELLRDRIRRLSKNAS